MSKNLKQWRNATGLSQTEFAKKIGVTKQTLYKWERGMSPVATVHWDKYSHILGIDANIFEDALIETLLAYALETLDPQVLRAAQVSGKYDAVKLADAITKFLQHNNEQGVNMTKLAFYRRKAGLTQESLGEKLGVSKQLISAWENFAAVIDPKHVDKLKSALDLSEAEIIDIVADAQCGTRGLAYYRKRKGISQEEMGEYLSVPKANISAWENGTRGIPLKHFDKIARMLDLTEAELQEVIAHCREEERTVAVPEIVGELAQKIYDKAWERAKLRQESLREKFMGQLKQTYAGFTEEEYQEILYSLIKDEISPILIRGEISRMTSSIAFLAHAAEQGE